jgi:hypothetical protein
MASSSDFYYWVKLSDTSFNDDIIRFIDSKEDEQKHSTNVKAKMTGWHVENEKEFEVLKMYILDFAKEVSKEKYNQNISFQIESMWGAAYKKGDFTLAHDHWPATWASCYYINPPKKCSGLYFNDLDEELIVENGMLVLFPGWVRHEVKSQKIEGTRYVVAANLRLE